MKKLVLSLLVSHSLLTLWGQVETTIKVDIKGLTREDTLTLSWGAINKSMNPLIAQLALGEDTLSLPLNEPRLITLGLKGAEGSYDILAAPDENIEVTGRLHIDNMGKRPRAEFKKMKVTGAQYHPVYSEIITRLVYHLDSLATNVNQSYKGIKRLILGAKRRNDEQAIADMYQTREGKDYIERIANNYNDYQQYVAQTVASHKDSFLGPMLMLRLGGRLTPEQRPLYESMSPEAQQSYYGREVREEVAPMSMLGTPAPPVSVSDPEGEEHLLSFASEKGQLLLIDFWASWCQPCLKEIANLRKLYEQYHSRGLNIVSISADINLDDWTDMLDVLSLPWDNYIDHNQQAATEYGVKYIPSLFIVDDKGQIVAEKLRGQDLENYLEGHFAE